jgi:hypothetical protein
MMKTIFLIMVCLSFYSYGAKTNTRDAMVSNNSSPVEEVNLVLLAEEEKSIPTHGNEKMLGEKWDSLKEKRGKNSMQLSKQSYIRSDELIDLK